MAAWGVWFLKYRYFRSVLLAVQGEAVLEQLGALLAPVAAPVAGLAVGAVAVEAGKDVKGVGRGHGALLEWVVGPGSLPDFYPSYERTGQFRQDGS